MKKLLLILLGAVFVLLGCQQPSAVESLIDSNKGKSEITEFTLSFDDTKISVAKDVKYLKNGDKVNKGDSIKIYVTNIEEGKAFDKFVISGKEYNPEVTGVMFRYAIESLDSTYANGSVIEISYTTKDLIAYTVTFEGEDGGTISHCEIVGGNDITNGETVYEGQTLRFTATPSEGKVVDKWYVNGTEQSYYASDKYCYVTLRPSEITGTEVKVTCSFRPAVEYKVTFGEKISCRDISNRADIKTINPGSTVYEGHVLEFSVSPEAGQIVKNWSLNRTEQSDSEDQKQFIVELRRSEITENTVDVTCSFRPAVEYEVTFGEEISCSDITNLPEQKPIGSGSTVYEGQMLEFKATPPEGMVVDKWYINEEESNSDYGWYGEFYVILQPSEITDHKLNITVTFKQQ